MAVEFSKSNRGTPRTEIEVPALYARGRSCSRSESRCCSRDWSRATPSALWARSSAVAGAVGWFRDVLPHEAHESVPVIGASTGTIATTRHEVARVEIARGIAARVAAARDLSDFGGNQGRSGRKRGHGAAGDALRHCEPDTASGIRSIFWLPAFFPARADRDHGCKSPHFNLHVFLIAVPIHLIIVAAGRIALRRDAADASAAADSAGRLHRSPPVVRSDSTAFSES